MTAQPTNYGKAWTRQESILAFELYCRIPFQQTKASNVEVQELARLLDRSPASVARKLGNFGAFDPDLRRRNISGLTHTSKLDRKVWDEFNSDWPGLVALAREMRGSVSDREAYPLIPSQSPKGESERLVTAKRRLHQAFFRDAVLSAHEGICCITGISIRQCLIASHIVPWSVSEKLRADPTNGLCLTATFDRLFDTGLMTVNLDLTLRFSEQILLAKAKPVQEFITIYNGRAIRRPQRFHPKEKHLEWHRENVFVG